MNNNPQLVEKLIWRETDDGIVVVDPIEGKVRVLNGVGSEIWKLVNQRKSRSDIQQAIAGTYNISEGQAEADITAFLDQLSARGMIEYS